MTEIPVTTSVYPPGQPPTAPEYGDWQGMFSGIHAHLGKIAGAIDRPGRVRQAESDNVWSIDIDPVPMAITGSNGILDLPQLLGPSTGEHWDVHTISATGFTAGTVLGFINLSPSSFTPALGVNQQAALRAVFSSAGLANFGKNQCHLRGTDRLVFVGIGLTIPAGGQVLISLGATRVAEPYWGRYLI